MDVRGWCALFYNESVSILTPKISCMGRAYMILYSVFRCLALHVLARSPRETAAVVVPAAGHFQLDQLGYSATHHRLSVEGILAHQKSAEGIRRDRSTVFTPAMDFETTFLL